MVVNVTDGQTAAVQLVEPRLIRHFRDDAVELHGVETSDDLFWSGGMIGAVREKVEESPGPAGRTVLRNLPEEVGGFAGIGVMQNDHVTARWRLVARDHGKSHNLHEEKKQ